MPDRNASESQPEYQLLVAGQWEHKGEATSILQPKPDTKVDPYQDPTYNPPHAVAKLPDEGGTGDETVLPATQNPEVRKRLSRLFQNLFK